MKMIDFFKEVMARPISRKDRIQFVLVLIAFAAIYFYLKYFKKEIPFADYDFKVYGVLIILASIAVFKIIGNTIIRCWLIISGVIGKIIFSVILFVVYFVFLVPVFKSIQMFTKSKKKSNSNWELNTPANSDYKSMG